MNTPRFSRIITALTFASLLASASLRAGDTPPAHSTANATNRFTITGMHCDGCANGLASELKRTPGVTSATVTFSNRLAVVAFDTNRVTTAKLVKAAEEAGFKAEQVTK
jgi:copper chaperone CopZ